MASGRWLLGGCLAACPRHYSLRRLRAGWYLSIGHGMSSFLHTTNQSLMFCSVYCRFSCVLLCLLRVRRWTAHSATLQALHGPISCLLFFSFSPLPPPRGFNEDWIAETFAVAQMGNGFMAVLAGVISQVSADFLGDIGPFQVGLFTSNEYLESVSLGVRFR